MGDDAMVSEVQVKAEMNASSDVGKDAFENGPLKVGYFEVHRYLSDMFSQLSYCVVNTQTGTAVAIDPGHGSLDFFKSITQAGHRITRVLLTHGHFDHVAGVHDLCEELDMCATAHIGDRKLIRQAQLYSIRWCHTPVPVPKKLDFFSDDTSIAWDGGDVEVVLVPGHTMGGVCYKIGEMIFTGDTLLRERVGPTFYPDGDRDVLLNSVEKLLEKMPPSTLILSGHGRPWTIGDAAGWWRRVEGDPPVLDIFSTDK